MKGTFRTGWSGSPFQTGYDANQGANGGSAAKPSDMIPRVGAGAMGKRVKPEADRTTNGKNQSE